MAKAPNLKPEAHRREHISRATGTAQPRHSAPVLPEANLRFDGRRYRISVGCLRFKIAIRDFLLMSA